MAPFNQTPSPVPRPRRLPRHLLIKSTTNARVLPPYGLVMQGNRIVNLSKWYLVPDKVKPSSLLHNNRTDVGVPRNKSANGELVNLVQFGSVYFQHIVLELPKVQIICAHLLSRPDVAILVACSLQQELTTLVCPSATPDRFVVLQDRPVRARLVHVPYHAKAAIGLNLAHSLRPLALPRPCPAGRCTPPSDLVYIPRRHGTKRSVLDEELLLAALRAAWRPCGAMLLFKPYNDLGRGFRGATSPWQADRAALSNTRVLVAPHGGALGNIAFAPAGTTVIELISSSGLRSRPCYYGLALALGFKYVSVEPTSFDFSKPMHLGPRAIAEVERNVQQACAAHELGL
jgi:hypothetical protein